MTMFVTTQALYDRAAALGEWAEASVIGRTCSERGEDDYDDDYDGLSGYCYECGDRGWIEYIHGDPPSPCMTCNPKGMKDDCF